jgi:hypothetical protein
MTCAPMPALRNAYPQTKPDIPAPTTKVGTWTVTGMMRAWRLMLQSF